MSRREARAWLRTNPSPAALAFNTLRTPARMRRFVERVYRAGAERVEVDTKDMGVDFEPHRGRRTVSTDALYVTLPAGAAMARVDAALDRGAPQEKRCRTTLMGRRVCRLWWD